MNPLGAAFRLRDALGDYGIVVARDVMVPMRDGVRLATDLYRPAADGEPLPGPFPAILGRTSYDKSSGPMWVEPVGEFFCRRGYVVVLQATASASTSRAATFPAST